MQGNKLSAGPKIVRFGGSTIERENVIFNSAAGNSVVWNGTILSFTTTSDHGLHSGTQVFISSPKIATLWVLAECTRVSATTITVPYAASAGTNLGLECHITIQNRYTTQSTFRQLNAMMNGALELVANYSTGGTRTSVLKERVGDIRRLKPDIVSGSFGIGNQAPDSPPADRAAFDASVTSAYETIVNDIVAPCAADGISTIIEFPIGTLATDAPWQLAWFQRVKAKLQAYMLKEKRFFVLDPTYWSTDASTGKAFEGLFRRDDATTFDPVHPNQTGCYYVALQAKAMHDHLIPSCTPIRYQTGTFIGSTPIPSFAQSVNDRVSASGYDYTTNLYLGGWDNSFVPNPEANLNSRAHGKFVPQTTAVQLGPGSVNRGVTADITNRGDDSFNQQYTFVGAANDSFRVVVGIDLSQVKVNTLYKLFLDFNIASTSDAIKQYAVYVRATFNYGGTLGSQTGILGAAVTNATTPSDFKVPLPPVPSAPAAPYEPLATNYMKIPSGVTVTELSIVFECMLSGATTSGTVMNWGRLAFREVPLPVDE